MEVVRLGVLGAARIAPAALIKPARDIAPAEVVAIAARDRARAEKFAEKHGVPNVFADYDALIAAPMSTRSTTLCRTGCTRNGRPRRSKRASTCFARSRSRRTPPKQNSLPRLLNGPALY